MPGMAHFLTFIRKLCRKVLLCLIWPTLSTERVCTCALISPTGSQCHKQILE